MIANDYGIKNWGDNNFFIEDGKVIGYFEKEISKINKEV